jgi:Asp-tRNA(Asn)/Glu-tRNA(Gln) amidotransferase A subunit family amidase
MARNVTDLATLLDCMVGYDPEDPQTAHGFGQFPRSYRDFLDREALKGARLGILRTSMGNNSEPDSEDFAKVGAVFDRAVDELRAAGATVVDPIEISKLNELLAKRAGEGNDGSFEVYMGRNANPPFRTQAEMRESPLFAPPRARARASSAGGTGTDAVFECAKARDELMTNVLKVMADHNLDAIVHKTVEHQPTPISLGVNPPYVSSKGAAHLNTFLIYAASIAVPAGFTTDGLPAGITFFGRPYSEPRLISVAYAYEQAYPHRRPPETTPRLPGEP